MSNETPKWVQRYEFYCEDCERLIDATEVYCPNDTCFCDVCGVRVIDLPFTVVDAKDKDYDAQAKRIAELEKRISRCEPEHDATDAACPAWWRGQERGYEVAQKRIAGLRDTLAEVTNELQYMYASYHSHVWERDRKADEELIQRARDAIGENDGG